jgi:hypothetical protein
MGFVVGSHNAYMHEWAPRAIARRCRFRDADGKPIQTVVTIPVEATDDDRCVPWGTDVDYSEFERWCDEHLGPWFSWSPFTQKWRTYFTFVSEADALAFKLRFG